jgi:transcription elongation factor
MHARRAFSPADAKEARLLLEQRRRPDGGGYYYTLNGARYEDGYLLRSYALQNLQAEEALPPLEDLQRFNQVPRALLALQCPVLLHTAPR